jgi:hypothetical protein
MKNKGKLFGIAAIALAIVLGALLVTGCPNPADSGSGKSSVIDIAAIQGVTAPATGGTPVKAITETAQYSGTVTWSPAHSTFAADTQYTATIPLKAKDGYTLQGVEANFFTVAGAAATNAANPGVITAVFPKTGGTTANPTVISIAAIPGITIPETGKAPVKTITETAQYTGTVTWSPADNPFKVSTIYTATITLTPKTGFTLQGVAANFFTVAGATSVSNSANSDIVTAVFSQTGGTAENPAVISAAAIQGITIPETGGTPVTIIENSQYSGTVTWHGNPVIFAASSVYTATITLIPKTGYTLQGVAANFFTVAGAASVSNSANSGIVTAVFPQTAAKTVINIAIKTQPTTLSYGDGSALNLTGLEVTLTYNDTTTEDVAAAKFTEKNLTTNPAQGVSLSRTTHNGQPVTITYGGSAPPVQATTAALSVKLAVTVAVAAPALNRTAHNRILISVTSSVSGGLSIEYGISASNNAFAAVWQSGLLFTGLEYAKTYYIFARIAERGDYSAGPASDSLQVTTCPSDVLTVTSTAEWTDALAHISVFGNGTAETPQTYTITVSGNVPVAGSTNYSFGSVSNVVVTLQGSGKLYLNSGGNMIRTTANQTLIIDSAALTLQGLKSDQNGSYYGNNAPVIDCSGSLELKNGEISGNSNGGGNGGVSAITFTMSGGIISGNSGSSDSSSNSYFGGGVYARTFTMTGGTISDNSGGSNCSGGVYAGTFTMSGGIISGNSGNSVGSYCSNGVSAGTFTMNGGTISGNSGNSGTGVYVNANSSFTMNGGTISGNSGAGVYAAGTFTMNGGIISGNSGTGAHANTFTMNEGTISGNSYRGVSVSNTFTMSGGIISGNGSCGVYVRGTDSSFTMTGGTISGNNNSYSDSYSYGGGVYAENRFAKTGGIIYGNDASDTNKNTVSGANAYGHAVYLYRNSSTGYYRDSTLGESDNLSSSSPLPVNSGQTLNGWTKR